MSRKITAAAVLVAAISLLAASCTLPAPAKRTWKVRPVAVDVVYTEDWDAGDEPYVIQLGFRSKVGVANSSAAFVRSQCWSWAMPSNDIGSNGSTVNIPPGSADIVFPEVQNLDIGDVLLGTAPFEIFGTLSFVVERDGPIFNGACALSDTINTVLSGVIRDSLDLLVAAYPVPPTEQQLIDMIVSHLGDFLSVLPGVIGIAIEGLGDAHDLLGTAVQIHLPTKGAFRDALNLGLNLAGLENGQITDPALPAGVAFRIGHLLPSSASFTFDNPGGWEHVFHSSITG